MDAKLTKLPPLLRSMIRVTDGCWYAFNTLGKPTALFWNVETNLSTPIPAFVFQTFGGTHQKGQRFVRTCGHNMCVNPVHMLQATPENRLIDYIERRGNDECWPWIGAQSVDGYGVITAHGKVKHAHRAAYERAHGRIPDGLVIRHMCNNPLCCNPKHLQRGTRKDNSEDIVKSGLSFLMGRHEGDTEAVDAAVADVIGGMTASAAARKHGCSRVSVWRRMNPK